MTDFEKILNILNDSVLSNYEYSQTFEKDKNNIPLKIALDIFTENKNITFNFYKGKLISISDD